MLCHKSYCPELLLLQPQQLAKLSAVFNVAVVCASGLSCDNDQALGTTLIVIIRLSVADPTPSPVPKS